MSSVCVCVCVCVLQKKGERERGWRAKAMLYSYISLPPDMLPALSLGLGAWPDFSGHSQLPRGRRVGVCFLR